MSRGPNCIACATVSGVHPPPGGVVFDNEHWLVVLRSRPVRFPCLPLIILKRHEENIVHLDNAESASMGQTIQWTAQILSSVLQPARIHFGIYAEEVKHLHVHVFPRMNNMPPGNIPNLWINAWTDILHSLRLKKAYPNEVVSQYAEKLRQAYLEHANYNQINGSI